MENKIQVWNHQPARLEFNKTKKIPNVLDTTAIQIPS